MSTQTNAAHAILLIGLGTRGRMWTRVIDSSPNSHIAAAVDPHESTRTEFATNHPGVPVFATHQEALAAGIPYTAAVLVTPPDGHLQQCRDLYQANLPILAEKPLTLDLAESVRIVELADEHNLPLTIGLNFRYLPVHQKYREMLHEKVLGSIGFGEFIYRRHRNGRRPGINKYPLTMEQPMMLEQSIHHLDLIRFCYGREVESIMCRTWNPSWSMYADDANVHALLTLEGNVAINYFGTWSGGWNVPGFEWRTDCECGVIVQRELFSDLTYAKTADTELTPVQIEPAEAFYDDTAALLADFLQAVDNNQPVPCNGRDHLRTLALCFAGIESSRTGKAIVMREFYEQNGLLRLLE